MAPDWCGVGAHYLLPNISQKNTTSLDSYRPGPTMSRRMNYVKYEGTRQTSFKRSIRCTASNSANLRLSAYRVRIPPLSTVER